MPRSKITIFWAGISLLAVGAIFASFGIWSAIRERTNNRDLESMVGDLRANGAIVENYYKVIGGDGLVRSQRHWIRSCIVAGILVATGASMIAIAKRHARLEHLN